MTAKRVPTNPSAGRVKRALRSALLACIAAAIGACAAQPAPSAFTQTSQPTVAIDAGAYASAFAAARDALRSAGFTLDRIDARAGVITTLPASSAGLATPWSRLDASSSARFRRTLRYERLRARVEFTPTGAGGADPWDLARFEPGAIARVRVEVESAPRPGLRVDPLSPRLSSVTRPGPGDPGAGSSSRLEDQAFMSDLAESDDALASKIAHQLATALRQDNR